MSKDRVTDWLRTNIRVRSVSRDDSDGSISPKSPKRRIQSFLLSDDEEESESGDSISSNPKRRERNITIVNEPLLESDLSLGEYCVAEDYCSAEPQEEPVQNSNSCSDYFSENSNKIIVKELKFPCGTIEGCRPKSNSSSNRPSHTFHCLITHAIEEVGGDGSSTTSQIIDFLSNEFVYFAETPDNIWMPSVKNILKKSFNCISFCPNSEPSWFIKGAYDPENHLSSNCSTISSVQSYETTDSAKKVIVGLDLDISEEENEEVDVERDVEQEIDHLEEDLDVSDSDSSDPAEENGLWQVKQASETKISIAKISETKTSKPKFSINYIVALVLKDQPLTKEEIISEIIQRFPYFKSQKEDWKKAVHDVLMKSDYYLPKKIKGFDVAKWSIRESDYQKLHEEEFRKLPKSIIQPGTVKKRRGRPQKNPQQVVRKKIRC